MTYAGMEFTLADCRDWSVTMPVNDASAAAQWPIPNLNLLTNFHFTGSTASWNEVGAKTVASAQRSTTSDDTRFGTGVSYLSLGCGGTCQLGQMIYQDIPISKIHPGSSYDFAVSAVSHGTTAGKILMTLDQVNSKGKVL
jgi:hypothetical protein